MKARLAQLSPRIKRYLIIGVSVYLFELAVIVVAQHYDASSVQAVGLSFWLGLIASFVLQKFVTFGDKRTARRILLSQVLAFGLLVIFNFGFTVLMTKILAPPLPAALVRTIALGVTTAWNFYLYKTRIFQTNSGLIY